MGSHSRAYGAPRVALYDRYMMMTKKRHLRRNQKYSFGLSRDFPQNCAVRPLSLQNNGQGGAITFGESFGQHDTISEGEGEHTFGHARCLEPPGKEIDRRCTVRSRRIEQLRQREVRISLVIYSTIRQRAEEGAGAGPRAVVVEE